MFQENGLNLVVILLKLPPCPFQPLYHCLWQHIFVWLKNPYIFLSSLSHRIRKFSTGYVGVELVQGAPCKIPNYSCSVPEVRWCKNALYFTLVRDIKSLYHGETLLSITREDVSVKIYRLYEEVSFFLKSNFIIFEYVGNLW